MVFKTDYRLMQVKCIAEFQPSLSYHLSLRSLFCLFLGGHFTQVYCTNFEGVKYMYFALHCKLKILQECSCIFCFVRFCLI